MPSITTPNFRQLDLNLLRVLSAIHRTGSVTLAGRTLALSQPATSNALARLRQFFGDELFVRAGARLEPTRLCDELAPAVIIQLQALESTVVGRRSFDPASGEMHWRLSLSDLGEILLLPPIVKLLRAESPASRLTNVSAAVDEVARSLESRDVDLAIGILPPRHQGVRSELLFREVYVAIALPDWQPRTPRSIASGRAGDSRRQPASARTRRPRPAHLSVAQLAQAGIIVASPTATLHGAVERLLDALKLTDRIVLRPRHFGAMPDLVRSAGLLAIVPQMYAHMLATREGFRIWALPETRSYDVNLLWHRSTDDDPAMTWLRGRVRELFARPLG